MSLTIVKSCAVGGLADGAIHRNRCAVFRGRSGADRRSEERGHRRLALDFDRQLQLRAAGRRGLPGKISGITVKYSRTPAGEMALKLQNEIRANSVQADVFDANSAFFRAMPLENLVEYKPEAAARIIRTI